MPRSILILHKKKERKKGEKVVIDEIARRIETTKRTKNGAWKKGGRKMVQVAHRQITLLPIPSSASLPFFPPEERRSTCNSSSRSSRRFPRFRKRPRWFVRSTRGRGRSHLHPLATVTWKPVPKSGRIANHQGWDRLFAQSW